MMSTGLTFGTISALFGPSHGIITPGQYSHLVATVIASAVVLLIALGGAIGAAQRYLTSVLAARWFGAEFPYGTLIVNLGGPFIIGFVQQVGAESVLIPDNARLFLTTGMMGGLTTYSTFSYGTIRLMEGDAWHQAGSTSSSPRRSAWPSVSLASPSADPS